MSTSVALSSHFETFIQEQIDSGRYNNVSEVIRAGLRALEEQEQNRKLVSLRVAIEAGMNSGEGVAADEVFSRLRTKYQQQADAGKK